MESTLPLWFLATAALPLVVAVLLVRAAFRIRHLRSLLDEATRKAAQAGAYGPPHEWQTTGSEDWVAGKR